MKFERIIPSILISTVWVMPFSNDRVSAFIIPDFAISHDLMASLGSRYRDAVQIDVFGGEAWLFEYGVIVFWGVDEDEKLALLHRLQVSEGVLTGKHQEHLRFVIEGDVLKLHQDMVVLPGEDELLRLSISHGLAQSVKLEEYESKAQDTISEYGYLPKALAETGKIKLGRTALAKIRGHLFSTKSDIFLHYGLLDTPEFFWEYSEYEYAYALTSRYLDIRSRVELLSNKLDVIHELFEMLADDLNHKHSSFLEWIIIILIAFEIATFGAEELKAILM